MSALVLHRYKYLFWLSPVHYLNFHGSTIRTFFVIIPFMTATQFTTNDILLLVIFFRSAVNLGLPPPFFFVSPPRLPIVITSQKTQKT
jgi:hypothetical protein